MQPTQLPIDGGVPFEAKQLNLKLLHPGRKSSEWEGAPPLMRLSYRYQHSFPNICDAYFKKHNWEKRAYLTTIAHVEQTDDDTLTYIRRNQSVSQPGLAWERVTINRRDNTMVADSIIANEDGSAGVVDTHKFWAEGAHTENELASFSTASKEFRLEQFKYGIAKTLKSLRFSQLDQE